MKINFLRKRIVVLGMPKSGKTDLLRGTSLSLTATDKTSVKAIKSTQLNKTPPHYRLMRTLHHAVLVIDLPSLLTLKKETLDQLSAQLKNLQKHSKVVPVSIVISKCDKLDGFTDMFDDMGTVERQQIFGVTFSDKDRENDLNVAFKTSFTALINQVKNRLLNRMHREQIIGKRQRIYAFPEKLSTLSNFLETLITSPLLQRQRSVTGHLFYQCH